MKRLAIDLFCGLGGWSDGLIATGWDCIGFDIERHDYGEGGYPGQLVLQDVLTLHGSQFKDADLIVASPPCQFFSYTAMPWSRAKALAAEVRADPAKLAERLALFKACFRIQREACEASGRHIPMVVENVKGAQPWVGRAAWSFGSFFLWGDVPALMPIQRYHQRLKGSAGEQWNVNRPNFTGTLGWDEGVKRPGHNWSRFKQTGEVSPHWRMDGDDSRKVPGFRFDGSGRSFQSAAVEGVKNPGRSLESGKPRFNDRIENFPADVSEGRKGAGAGAAWFDANLCQLPSGSSRRKAASAKIAKIPLVLAEWIGRAHHPDGV